jgi:pimeloyl-ACP methyl ester carboxylesterase/protein-tyrosine phosphatase
MDKLPSDPPLPLLVFIHGLGGSASQFAELINRLINQAPCLAIDLPGCGKADMAPRTWNAYTMEQLVELLYVVVEEYRDRDHDQGVILIGHSMGCSLATHLGSSTTPFNKNLAHAYLGSVAICPRAQPLSDKEQAAIRKLVWVPTSIFNLWREWDRRGGIGSHSVTRFVGTGADVKTRKLQLKFNSESRTETLMRMLLGMVDAMPGPDVWRGLHGGVLLIGAENDKVTPPENVHQLLATLKQRVPLPDTKVSQLPPAATNSTAIAQNSKREPNISSRIAMVPAPASHGLFYASGTVRVILGLITDFLESKIDRRLAMGWQLQHFAIEGKWDVKNLAKWQAITPVGDPVGGVFRVMKTLREVDDKHNPRTFGKEWGYRVGHDSEMVSDVVDISHETPVYDPAGLEESGIHYHKFPTVSKFPPSPEEVAEFISLVDQIRDSRRAEFPDPAPPSLVAVHCHYGFNRSGFFVVCYLVERCGYSLERALDEFAERRPHGIKHGHFIDTLYVRYATGLRRGSVI